jgi:hypothetical protein
MQPLPPVGDPGSEGVWPVPEVPVTGAQHLIGSIPVGIWNSARSHGTQGLANREQSYKPLCPSLQCYPLLLGDLVWTNLSGLA